MFLVVVPHVHTELFELMVSRGRRSGGTRGEAIQSRGGFVGRGRVVCRTFVGRGRVVLVCQRGARGRVPGIYVRTVSAIFYAQRGGEYPGIDVRTVSTIFTRGWGAAVPGIDARTVSAIFYAEFDVGTVSAIFYGEI